MGGNVSGREESLNTGVNSSKVQANSLFQEFFNSVDLEVGVSIDDAESLNFRPDEGIPIPDDIQNEVHTEHHAKPRKLFPPESFNPAQVSNASIVWNKPQKQQAINDQQAVKLQSEIQRLKEENMNLKARWFQGKKEVGGLIEKLDSTQREYHLLYQHFSRAVSRIESGGDILHAVREARMHLTNATYEAAGTGTIESAKTRINAIFEKDLHGERTWKEMEKEFYGELLGLQTSQQYEQSDDDKHLEVLLEDYKRRLADSDERNRRMVYGVSRFCSRFPEWRHYTSRLQSAFTRWHSVADVSGAHRRMRKRQQYMLRHSRTMKKRTTLWKWKQHVDSDIRKRMIMDLTVYSELRSKVPLNTVVRLQSIMGSYVGEVMEGFRVPWPVEVAWWRWRARLYGRKIVYRQRQQDDMQQIIDEFKRSAAHQRVKYDSMKDVHCQTNLGWHHITSLQNECSTLIEQVGKKDAELEDEKNKNMLLVSRHDEVVGEILLLERDVVELRARHDMEVTHLGVRLSQYSKLCTKNRIRRQRLYWGWVRWRNEILSHWRRLFTEKLQKLRHQKDPFLIRLVNVLNRLEVQPRYRVSPGGAKKHW